MMDIYDFRQKLKCLVINNANSKDKTVVSGIEINRLTHQIHTFPVDQRPLLILNCIFYSLVKGNELMIETCLKRLNDAHIEGIYCTSVFMQNVFRDLPYELLNYRGLIPLPIQFICHDMKTFSTSKDPKERIRSLLFKNTDEYYFSIFGFDQYGMTVLYHFKIDDKIKKLIVE